jgi:hypothetical protein
LYPATPLDVLVFQDKLTLCWGEVAEPLRDSTVGELEALLTNVTFDDAVPAFWGVNATWNERLLPATIVTGSEMPVTEN